MSALDGDSQAPFSKVSVRVCVEIYMHVHDEIGVEAVENERPLDGRQLRGGAQRHALDLRLLDTVADKMGKYRRC